MAKFTTTQLAEWSGGAWSVEPDVSVAGISHDTRTLKPGEVFIALRGPNFDAHNFVERAFEKGAVGAIVGRDGCPQPSTDASERRPCLVVPDTMKALWNLAQGTRRDWRGTVIGITGSVGKTTVKDLIASMLAQKGTVSKTPGNWNNEFGLPLSMLAADPASDYFVFELGMNRSGEIDRLAELLSPDWALITAIGKAHTEFFDSVEQIAAEKAAILKHAGAALLDIRSEWFGLFKTFCTGRIVSFGDKSLNFSVAQPGTYMAENVQQAAALGLELGLTHEQIQAGLDAFRPAPMRWERSEQNGMVFINDAYNANPLSMRAAISTFAELPGAKRKFLVLGGMRELGAESDAEHRALGEFIEPFGFEGVIAVGDAGAKIACAGIRRLNKPDALKFLRGTLRAGDMVLFKASRGEKLETVLDEFRKEG